MLELGAVLGVLGNCIDPLSLLAVVPLLVGVQSVVFFNGSRSLFPTDRVVDVTRDLVLSGGVRLYP